MEDLGKLGFDPFKTPNITILSYADIRRHTDITGWRFNAIIVLKYDRVEYKLWSGQPSIKEVEDDHNPLGPLQGSGSRLISY